MLFIPALFAVAAADPSALEFNVRRSSHKVAKRDEALDSRLFHVYLDRYLVDVGIGSPPQTMQLYLDMTTEGLLVKFFEPDESSTYIEDEDANPNLIDCDAVFSHDTMIIGDQQINDVDFAYVTLVDPFDEWSYLGIGFPDDSDPCYHNMSLPVQLRKQGIISTAAYSIFLNSADQTEGSFLLGSIDESKIDGDLYKFPIVDDYKGNRSISIALDGLFLIDPEGTRQKVADSSLSLTLNPSESFSVLPWGMLEPLFAAFGADYAEDFPRIDCSLLQNGGGIGLSFSGIEFDFSFRDIAVDLGGFVIRDDDDNIEQLHGYCSPGFVVMDYPSDIRDYPWLGLNFLRQLYVVVDLDNEEIGLGKAKFDATSSSYVEMSSGIPASKAPRYRSRDEPLQIMKPYPVTFGDLVPVTHSPQFTYVVTSPHDTYARTVPTKYNTGSPSDYYTDVHSTIGQVTGTGAVSTAETEGYSTVTFTEKSTPTVAASSTDRQSESSQEDKSSSASDGRKTSSASSETTGPQTTTAASSKSKASSASSARSSSSSSSASKSKDAAPKQAVSAGLATFGLLGFLALI